MFDTPDTARAVLDNDFTPPQIELIVDALQPSIQFVPMAQQSSVSGETRIGGLPDLPPHLDWPSPTYPPHIAEITTRGSPDANEDMQAHVARGMPFAFMAQIDLAQVKALGTVADGLPDHGRLLFFYDLSVGAYDAGAWTARVIWDRSPVHDLAPRALPQPLREASDDMRRWRAEFDEERRREYGDDAEPTPPDAGTPYDAPARPMRLELALRPPAAEAVALDRHDMLQAVLAVPRVAYEETFADRYSALFAYHFDPYYGPANRGHRHQLLGSPLPEQSDPRYEAAAATEREGQTLDPAVRDRQAEAIDAAASQWRLLLQIDVADWMQDDGEGTVYFLIRAEDLEARRFERVVAVYQQT